MGTVVPSLFIGLGNRGVEFAEAVSSHMARRNDALARVHRLVAFRDSGEVRAGVEATSVPETSIKGLCDEIRPGVWRQNYEIALDHEKVLADLLARHVELLNHPGVRQELIDRGVQVDSSTDVTIFVATSSAVGSALLPAVLALIEKTLRPVFNPQVSVMLLAPGLFPESDRVDECLVRHYCAFAEIDELVRNPKVVLPDGHFRVSHLWVVERGNERNEYLHDYRELVPMIAETIMLLLTGAISPDSHLGNVSAGEVGGQPAHYGSFGLKNLLWPREQVMDAITARMSHVILEVPGSIMAGTIDRREAFPEARIFLVKHGFLDIPTRVREKEDGTRCDCEFNYEGEYSEEPGADVYIEHLRDQSRQFENSRLPEAYQNLAERKRQLLTASLEQVDTAVADLLNRPAEQGAGLTAADAFLSALLDEPSEAFTGENPLDRPPLVQVQEELNGYFFQCLGVAPLQRQLQEARKRAEQVETELEAAFANGAEPGGPDTVISEGGSASGGPDGQSGGDPVLEAEFQELRTRLESLEQQLVEATALVNNRELCRRRIVGLFASDASRDFSERSGKLLATNDSLVQAKRKTAELEERRIRYLRLSCFVFPALILVGVALLGLLLWLQFGLNWVNSLKASASSLIICGVGYAIWRSIRYFNTIGRPLAASRAEVGRLGAELREQMLHLQENRRTYYLQLMDFERYQLAQEWYQELVVYLKTMLDQLRQFAHSLAEYRQGRLEFWEGVAFDNSLFDRHVVDTVDIDRYLEAKKGADLEIRQFFRSHPLSSYFCAFRNDQSLDPLVQDLRSFSEEAFSHIGEMSIEEAVQERHRACADPVKVMIETFADSIHVSAGFRIIDGIDESEEIVFVGVPNPDDSCLRRLFRDTPLDRQAVYVRFPSTTQVVALKFKAGFPAYYLNQVMEGRAKFSRLDDPTGFFSSPGFAGCDLLPSARLLGNHEDRIRQTARIGLALGLVRESPSGLFFEEKSLGKDFLELVTHLRSLAAAETLGAMEKAIVDSRCNAEFMIERLSEYMQREDLDDIDLRIVSHALGEITGHS